MTRRRLVPWLALPALLLALAGVAALRRADSSILLRTVTLSLSPAGIALDEQTERAFVFSGDAVIVLDTHSGAVLGTVAGGQGASALAVDQRARRVFVVDSGAVADAGSVRILDARSGQFLRTVALGNAPYAMAVDEQAGRVFVLNASSGSGIRGPVSVLDAGSGRLVRTIYAGPNGGPLLGSFTLAVDARRGRLFVITGGLLDNGPGNVLSVLDTATGRTIQTHVVFPSGMAVDEKIGRAFLISAGRLDVLDTASGRVLFKVATGPDFGTPIVDARRGRLFMSSPSGVSIRDARTGAILHSVALGRSPASPLAVDERTGRVLVAIVGPVDQRTYSPTGYGRVSVLDGQSGAVLRTVMVGIGPQAAAIDERTGHAFIVNSGGTLHSPMQWAWAPRWLWRWLPFLPSSGPSTHVVPGSVSVIDMRR